MKAGVYLDEKTGKLIHIFYIKELVWSGLFSSSYDKKIRYKDSNRKAKVWKYLPYLQYLGKL